MTAEEAVAVIRRIDEARCFMLAVYRDNPQLLARAEPRIRALFANRSAVAPEPRSDGQEMKAPDCRD